MNANLRECTIPKHFFWLFIASSALESKAFVGFILDQKYLVGSDVFQNIFGESFLCLLLFSQKKGLQFSNAHFSYTLLLVGFCNSIGQFEAEADIG